MKAAIYARVSTSDQNNTVQIAELTAYAKSRNWSVIEIHQDQMSGAKTKRPGLDGVLESARARRIDIVLVWKLDRFGRSTTDLSDNIAELKALGVRFIATTQGIDTDESNPVSRFLVHILAAVAELEREMIGERVRAGLALAKQKGVKLGPKFKVFNRDRVFTMRDEGASVRQIARELRVGIGTVHRLLSDVPRTQPESALAKYYNGTEKPPRSGRSGN